MNKKDTILYEEIVRLVQGMEDLEACAVSLLKLIVSTACADAHKKSKGKNPMCTACIFCYSDCSKIIDWCNRHTEIEKET